ncbi:nuclear transport factor 2 family protein [Anaerolineae bacterium CFX7]|nr:nuclear transport factor 2 family protein [Anaerolineae bacterium CFX7]
MHPNAQLVENFYRAFARRDYAAMLACYAPDIEFQDEIFSLRGKRVGAMWHMLCAASPDLQITFNNVQADAARGSAHWEARYVFGAAKRPVHNVLDAAFRFRDGKIISQRDRFDFYRWARMALGPNGLLFGWTPLVRNQTRQAAARNLEKFIVAHPEYQ